MSDDVKPELRSRRITVMGRRRSRQTGEITEESEARADEEASASDLEGPTAFGTQELDPPPAVDDGDKTNPRVRADEIAATLSRLTPEPEEPLTNPRIVLEALPGAPQRSGPAVVMAPAVVIGQAQIIGGSPPDEDDEDEAAQTDPPPSPDAAAPVRASIPTPGGAQRPSLSSIVGPAVAAFEAEQAAERARARERDEALADAPELPSDSLTTSAGSDAPEPWEDFDEAESEALAEADDAPEAIAAQQPRANTPPPPPSELARSSQTPQQPLPVSQLGPTTGPGAAKKPPPPPAPAASAAKAPAEEEKKRKRVRQWWERFFSEDYLLTVPPPTPAQISRQVDFIEQSLGIAKGAMVLDVGCGLGLHAIELARRGYLVVGLDLSLAMITRAAESAQQQGLKINFLHADIREIAFDGAFDAVICMGTTFGFFDDDANRDVLSRLYAALRPGGRILLDCVNRDYVVRWQPNLVWFEGEGCVCMEESDFNYFNSRLVVKRTVMREDGQQNNSEYSLRAYSLHELGQLVQALGFRVIEVSGQEATRGVFFGNVSTRILMLAERRVPQRPSAVMPQERSTGEVPRPPTTGEIPKPPPKAG